MFARGNMKYENNDLKSVLYRFQGCEEVSNPLMSSPTSSTTSSFVAGATGAGAGTATMRHRVNFVDVAGDDSSSSGLLPAPPATFSDPPPTTMASRMTLSPTNPSKGFVVGQQLLRVHAPPSGNLAGLRELESSVSSFYQDHYSFYRGLLTINWPFFVFCLQIQYREL